MAYPIIEEYSYNQMQRDYYRVADASCAARGRFHTKTVKCSRITVQKVHDGDLFDLNTPEYWEIRQVCCDGKGNPIDDPSVAISPVWARMVDTSFSQFMNGRKENWFYPEEEPKSKISRAFIAAFIQLLKYSDELLDVVMPTTISTKYIKAYRKQCNTAVIIAQAQDIFDTLPPSSQRQAQPFDIEEDDYLIAEYDPITFHIVQAKIVKLDAKLTALLAKNNHILILED